MKLLSILKRFWRKDSKTLDSKSKDYLPSFWEDDFCQIEIVPIENQDYIKEQITQIDSLSKKSHDGLGYTEIYGRDSMPISTITKEIRIDYFEKVLESFDFQRAKQIRYDADKLLDCQNGKIKAFGFNSFTIFFDFDDEFVKNIWISNGLIVSTKEYDNIKSALYALGDECNFILIDWNSLKITDLKNKTHIDKYLMDYWK